MADARKTFPEIGTGAFQHPLDRTATAALEKVPGMDWLIRKVLVAFGEKRMRLMFLGSAVRVDERQFPEIHKLLLETCEVLDVEEVPELFIAQNSVVNAAAIGVDHPFIVVNSSLHSMMDEDELRCVIAHEVGHIMCGHALYTTMLIIIMRYWLFFLGIPGGIYGLIAIRAALLEWSRKAELSADRAGLLVSQDVDVSMRVDMKLAGGKAAGSLDPEGFLAQAEDFKAGGDVIDGIIKLGFLLETTHPLPAIRVADIKEWAESDEYQAILVGEYAKRGGDTKSSFVENIRNTLGDYKDQVEKSSDPLLTALKDLGGGAAAVGEDILGIFTGRGKKD